ncbi:tetratricopeptide repeat-containing sensor histidine kinase [Chitinophaga rhizosphaerae]|uniref:tetratricopeptide repeat-containing sensor histidine kinase n=1 Tax=Chitinophaga rhizosphaerae TaxID=1864947 RepID=UPI000F8037DE|nr:ATP-binding protein [Chitinophaga rhizosphaerae]
MLRILSSFSFRSLPAVVSLIACGFACRQPVRPAPEKMMAIPSADTSAVRQLLRSAKNIAESLPDSASEMYDSAWRMSLAAKDTWAISMSLLGKGNAVSDTDFLLARGYYRQSLRLALAVDSFELAGRAATSAGSTFLQTGPPDSAVKAYMYALDLFSKTDNPTARSSTYNNLAIAFTQLEQDDKSKEYRMKAIAGYRTAKDTPNLVRSLINMGARLEYPEPIPFFLEAISLSDTSNFPLGKFYARLGIGEMYVTKANYDSASHFLRQAEAVAERQPVSKQYMSVMYAVMARMYYLQQRYAAARAYFGKSTKIALELGKLDLLEKQYRVLTKVNIMLGLREESVEAFDKFNTYRDSMQDLQVEQSINEMETQYRTAEKDLQLAEQERDLARKQLGIRNRNAGIYALSGIVLLLLVGGGAYLLHIRQNQLLAAQKLLTMEREAELEKVQAAMEAEEKERARIARNLHDGAGSILSGVKLYLASLENQYRGLAGSPAYKDTIGLLNDAVSEIRETSHNLMPKTLHLEGIHSAIRDYCGKVGRNEQLGVEFLSYGEPTRFDIDFELMIFRTFQELLNNVFKHAQATHVIVQLSFSPDIFSLTVEDDGKGMNGKQGDGIGMFAIHSRVEAFRGTMDVGSSISGTSINLQFPVPATTVSEKIS